MTVSATTITEHATEAAMRVEIAPTPPLRLAPATTQKASKFVPGVMRERAAERESVSTEPSLVFDNLTFTRRDRRTSPTEVETADRTRKRGPFRPDQRAGSFRSPSGGCPALA